MTRFLGGNSEALDVNETSGVVYALVGILAAIAGVASNTLVSRVQSMSVTWKETKSQESPEAIGAGSR